MQWCVCVDYMSTARHLQVSAMTACSDSIACNTQRLRHVAMQIHSSGMHLSVVGLYTDTLPVSCSVWRNFPVTVASAVAILFAMHSNIWQHTTLLSSGSYDRLELPQCSYRDAPVSVVLAEVGMVPFLHHIVVASQAVCHKWPRAFAVAACTQLALNYVDDVSLTEEVLLEPAKIALRVERGPADAPSHQQGTQGGSGVTPNHQQGVQGGTAQPHASALPLSMSGRQLSMPRPEPCPGGLCVQTRWGLGFTHAAQLSLIQCFCLEALKPLLYHYHWVFYQLSTPRHVVRMRTINCTYYTLTISTQIAKPASCRTSSTASSQQCLVPVVILTLAVPDCTTADAAKQAFKAVDPCLPPGLGKLLQNPAIYFMNLSWVPQGYMPHVFPSVHRC